MRRLEDTALAFDRAARKAGVGYALVGGFAVSAWGQPRTTSDIDALLDVDAASAPRFVGALGEEGLSLIEADLQDALAQGGHATIFDPTSSFHVDAKPCRTPAERDQVKSAVDIEFHGQLLRFARAEDTIVYKILYGTPQDLTDATTILARQEGKLDEARMIALAIKLDVAPKLRDLQARVRRVGR